jgi:beta-lactamase regulating signal transducer with metallopeptidase domain
MSAVIETTGWTLIHFAWQGALLALVTAAALHRCRRPQVRYAVACGGLAAMIAVAAATALLAGGHGSWFSAPDGSLHAAAGARVEAGPQTARDESMPQPAHAAGALNLERLLRVLVAAWAAGVTLLTGRLAGGCWRVRRVRLSATAARPAWQAASERLARRLHLGVAFRVAESRLVDAPAVIGWLRPLILLPVALASGLPPGQVEAVLAHELAHIRRRDYVVNLLQTATEALFFFHPGVWWVSARIREEREHCCDDAAVEAVGEVTAYAEALTALAAWHGRAARPSLGAADGSLLRRIRRLLGLPREAPASSFGSVAFLAAGAALAVTIATVAPAASALPSHPAFATQAAAANVRVRQTDHFEISHAPSLDLHAERIAMEAERAYERVSGDLRHNLGFKVGLVLFETSADLERSVQESSGRVGPQSNRERIVLAVDRPPDTWFGTITHELAHVFQFDIIPAGAGAPGWIAEGLAEYERGAWDPGDLVVLREAVRANAVPKLTAFQPDGTAAPRLAPAMGHAAFDFIESRWGKGGMRQFLFAVRQLATGGGDPYQAAFGVQPAAFDAAFDGYLRTRLSEPAAAPRFDASRSVAIEGLITAIGVPAAPGLACIEMLVARAAGSDERWGIECGQAGALDVIGRLRPGDRVVVTGEPALPANVHRLAMSSLLRPADGFVWRLPA